MTSEIRKQDGPLLGLLSTYASDDEEDENFLTKERSPTSLPDSVAVRSLQANLTQDEGLPAEVPPSQQLQELDIISGPQIEVGTTDADMEPSTVGPVGNEDELSGIGLELAEPDVETCSKGLQEKVEIYIKKQEQSNITIIENLRALPGYKNPDFLQHCVLYDEIEEYGTCFPKEVFDPSNLPKEDFYDRLAAEWEQIKRRRHDDRANANKIEFTKGPTETLSRATISGSSASIAAISAVAKAQASSHRANKWDSRS